MLTITTDEEIVLKEGEHVADWICRRIKTGSHTIQSTHTSDRHAIGERILAWVRSEEVTPSLVGSKDVVYNEIYAAVKNTILTNLETFIKKELL